MRLAYDNWQMLQIYNFYESKTKRVYIHFGNIYRSPSSASSGLFDHISLLWSLADRQAWRKLGQLTFFPFYLNHRFSNTHGNLGIGILCLKTCLVHLKQEQVKSNINMRTLIQSKLGSSLKSTAIDCTKFNFKLYHIREKIPSSSTLAIVNTQQRVRLIVQCCWHHATCIITVINFLTD